MKNQKSITKISAFALVLVLTISATLVVLPIVGAHDPPLTIPTYTYVAVVPETIGVNQQGLIVVFSNHIPPTANGRFGDRWTFHVDITKPDGSKETLGPITSDPVGAGWTNYTPDQVGTYTIVARMDDHVMTGEPFPIVGPIWNPNTINDTYLGGSSEPEYLTVQLDPIETYQETPLPTDYWTRPIYGTNRDWWKVAGQWLGGAAQQYGPTTNFAYGEGPESAHVLWTRPYWLGGVMDTRFGSIGYYSGLSYESFGSPNIIMNGRIYYTVRAPPRFGWYCVNLDTGETIYFSNTTGLSQSGGGLMNSGIMPNGAPNFGQIYDYESPNQHGGFGYLWVTSTENPNTWNMLDEFTGNYICSIANVSTRGTQVYGKDGSILYYYLDTSNNRLTVWNNTWAINSAVSRASPAPESVRITASTGYWQWRPFFNATFDGNYGYSLNVSIPDVSGSMRVVRESEFIIGGTGGSNDETGGIVPGNLWCLSLEPGKEGTLLWNRTFTPPKATPTDPSIVYGGGISIGTIDPEDGVFLFEEELTRQRIVYSLETGQQLWRSDSEAQFNFYGMSDAIYQGKLFGYGYSGELIAYNITTGEILWIWSAPSEGLGETWYPNSPLSLACIADGKLYMYSSEHSPTQPLRRDANIWCVDAESGQLLWKMSSWPNGGAAIADGRLVLLNLFDCQIYCYGKGPSATTVEVPLTAVSLGDNVMIRGTVTDQCAGARQLVQEGKFRVIPAVADEDQESWMEYLYQQRLMPEDAQGVKVKLTAIDPNGNYQDIGYATSDIAGNFGKSWQPPVPGEYHITATFEGSTSYGSSFDTTYFTVDPAPAPAQPIEPEPTTPTPTTPEPTTPEPATPEPTTPGPTTPEPTTPEPTEPAEAPFISTEIAIVAVVAVACVIGVVGYWALRRRK